MTVDDVRAGALFSEDLIEEEPGAPEEPDRWRRPFLALVIVGMVLAFVLGVYQVVDKPVIRLGDVRSTKEEGQIPRAQVLARNSSAADTYCVEVTIEAIDVDGRTLQSVVAEARTGGGRLRPGQSANFAAQFDQVTQKQVDEKLDDFLAFVTKAEKC